LLQKGIERGPEVAAIHRFPVAWSAGIELTGVGQLPSRIQNKEIRGAGGMPNLGHLL
jgi:hypothetical protein